MLFFELFPALLAIVSVVIAVALYAMNHGARDDPEAPPRAQKRKVPPGVRETRGRGRPSMR